MNKRKIALLLVAVHTGVMALGMFIMHYIFKYNYTEPRMSLVLVYFLVLLSIISILVIKKYYSFKKVGYAKIRWSQLIWIIPLYLIEGTFFLKVARNFPVASNAQMIMIVFIFFVTLLVAFAEETVYRGVLLHSYKNDAMPLKGIILSTLLFGALHLVNIFGGLSLSDAITQMISSSIMGVAMALMALRIKNIIPLIIYHFLWNFILISAQILEINLGYDLLLEIIYNFAISIVLLTLFFVEKKKKTQV